MEKNVVTGAERALASLISNDEAFISTFFKIPAKNQTLVPFILKPAQRKILYSLTGRDIIVKSSQVGCTSLLSALDFKRTLTHPNTTSVLMAHKEFLTQRLLNRVQVMYNHLPEVLKIPMEHRSAYEKKFESINSVMYIGTAQAGTFGRGEPIHHLLFSEAAFYPPGARDNIFVPSLQRVPDMGTIVLESTPNGEDELFYPEVQKALIGASSFNLIVIYWWEEPDNQLPPDTPLKIPDEWRQPVFDLSTEEGILMERHNLSYDQIRWRRYKIAESGHLFYQEQLENLETCFLRSGLPVYDPELLMAYLKVCYPAREKHASGASVWFKPEEKSTYVIGVDPGMGKYTESAAEVVQVFSDEHLRLVASLSGLYPPEQMGSRLVSLARYYNTALIVPEANSHGIALISAIKSYPRIYRRMHPVTGAIGTELGWLTTSKTKPFMMSELARRLPNMEIYDETLIGQLRAMKDLGDGRATSTILDDRHDALCLAVMGITESKSFRGMRGRSGWRW